MKQHSKMSAVFHDRCGAATRGLHRLAWVVAVWSIATAARAESEVAVVMADAAVRTVCVTDFGAVPDDGRDDTPAVHLALAAADKAHYPVTAVHLQWDFATPFHLNAVKNLTLDGADATFMMHGRMTPFVLNACEAVMVRSMAIEHERPSVFELKAVAKRDGAIDYIVADGDRFAIEGDRLVWFDADDHRQQPDIVQEYDPLRDVTWRSSDPLREARVDRCHRGSSSTGAIRRGVRGVRIRASRAQFSVSPVHPQAVRGGYLRVPERDL